MTATALPSPEERIVHLLRQIAESGQCRGCGAVVFWVHHKNGKTVPYTEEGLNHFVDCPQRERFRHK